MAELNKYSIIEAAYHLGKNIEFNWERSMFRIVLGAWNIDIHTDEDIKDSIDDMLAIETDDSFCLSILKENIQMSKLYISCCNLLGDWYYDKTKFDIDETIPTSYCGIYAYLFNLLRYLSPAINLDMLNTEFYFKDGTFIYGGSECDDPHECGVHCRLEINDYKKFIELLSRINGSQDLYISSHIELCYENNLNASIGVNILPSSIKTRRLGYLKIIAGVFDKINSIPRRLLNKKVEACCVGYLQDIIKLENSKGIVVETKTGSSAKPYIELAEKLKLINISDAAGRIGKLSKTYNTIKNELKDNDDNVFVLSSFDEMFFLENILKCDYIYVYTLLQLVYLRGKTNLSSLKLRFQDSVLSNIRNILCYNCSSSKGKKSRLEIIEKRIQSWEKPYMYTGHIIMPRINWLYELGMVEITNSTTFRITDQGERLFQMICAWIESNTVPFSDPEKYCANNFMKSASCIFKSQANSKITSNHIDEYLERAFVLFRTLAPNRVTYSHAISFIKYMIFFIKEEVVDEDEIRSYIENSNKYILKYQDAYGDGYIQHKK